MVGVKAKVTDFTPCGDHTREPLWLLNAVFVSKPAIFQGACVSAEHRMAGDTLLLGLNCKFFQIKWNSMSVIPKAMINSK